MSHAADCSCLNCKGQAPRDLRTRSERHTKRIQVMLTPSQYLRFLQAKGEKDDSVYARELILEKLP